MAFSEVVYLTTFLILFILLVLWLRLFPQWLQFLKALGFAIFSFFVIAWLAFDFQTGIVSGIRLLTLGTVFFLFFHNTSLYDLSRALLKMGCPYSFIFVLSASLQFIPSLIRHARNIRDAQRSRGIPIEGGIRALFYLPAFAGPLLIQSFKFADELAEAMEARGFGTSGRSLRFEPHFKPLDWIVAIGSITITISLLLIRVILWS